MSETTRTPVREKAKQFAKLLHKENPDYTYIRELFRHLRRELGISAVPGNKRLPYVPTEEEVQKYYAIVWKSRNMQNVIMVKTLLYTGVRVSELVRILITDVDFDRCQIRINQGKGKKDRIVPFPESFKEVLAMHVQSTSQKGAKYLFESSWKKSYSDRGVRKILAVYSKAAGMKHSISPHKFRHFLFTWLKKQGIEDALIQPYSGHESRQSLEVYSKLSIGEAQISYENIMTKFPV
jgi:integrase/recombinase XerD